MIKNIIGLLLFVASWDVAGMESCGLECPSDHAPEASESKCLESNCLVPEFKPNCLVPELKEPKQEYVELDCSMGVYKSCKGRCYKKQTQYNIISRHDQKLWTFYDPALGITDNPFRDPLIGEEYDALKVHTCLVNVKRPGVYFTKSSMPFPHTLITKFEFNPQARLLKRTLETFLIQLILAGKESKIYAWVNNRHIALSELLAKYGFIVSQEILYVPPSITRTVFCVESDILQLEASTASIRDTLF